MNDHRMRGHCVTCNRPIKRGLRLHWCGVGCKVIPCYVQYVFFFCQNRNLAFDVCNVTHWQAAFAVGGRRRDAALHLAELAEAGEFGPAIQLKNRFCVLCGLAYSDASCPNHTRHHHPAAAPGSVLTIVRAGGTAPGRDSRECAGNDSTYKFRFPCPV